MLQPDWWAVCPFTCPQIPTPTITAPKRANHASLRYCSFGSGLGAATVHLLLFPFHALWLVDPSALFPPFLLLVTLLAAVACLPCHSLLVIESMCACLVHYILTPEWLNSTLDSYISNSDGHRQLGCAPPLPTPRVARHIAGGSCVDHCHRTAPFPHLAPLLGAFVVSCMLGRHQIFSCKMTH